MGTKNDFTATKNFLIFFLFILFTVPNVVAGSFSLTATVPAGQNYVRLSWDPAGLPGYTPGRYRYAVNLLGENGTDWQTCSASYGKSIRVLNIHPTVRGNVPNPDKLKEWMETDGAGMGLITVDKVTTPNFNSNPDLYLKKDGEYQYDVIMFGSWDDNAGEDLSAAAVAAVTAFWASGRGVLFGHDTLMGKKTFGSLAYMANINAPLPELPYAWNSRVTVINNGFLLKYPNVIPDNATLTIPLTHSTGQQAKGVIWMNFTRPLSQGTHIDYTAAQGGGSNNFYLTTHNNAGMIQTGHSNGQATADEKKIIANTLMYLAQFTDTTEVDVYCAMDLTPPEMTVNVECNKITIKGKDFGSPNQFYVTATDGSTQDKYYSDTISATITTGLAGYFIVENDNASGAPVIPYDAMGRVVISAVTLTAKDNELITYTPLTAFKYVHVQAVDSAGNLSAVATTLIPSNNLPTAAINYPGKPFCTSASAQSVSISGTGAYTGGTYTTTPSGLTINSSTGAITPSSSTPGTYTVTYTIPGVGDCDDPVTTTVTITQAPSAIISYASPFCTSYAVQSVNFTGTTGGIYSVSPAGLTIDATTGAITPSSSNPNNYVVTYTIAAAGGCAEVTTTANVTITQGPSANITYDDAPFCTSLTAPQSVELTGGGAYTGGTYSATPAGLTINSSNGDITPSSSTPGTYTVTYTIPPSGGCAAGSATTSVVINQEPSVDKPTDQVVCNATSTTTVTFTGNIASGVIYNWTNDTPSIGLAAVGNGNITAFTATNTTNAPVTATITVTPTAAGCTGASKTFTITVNPKPVITLTSLATTTNQEICEENSITNITYTLSEGASNAIVTGLPSGVSFDVTGSTLTISGTPTQTGTFVYIAKTIGQIAPCAEATATGTIVINPNPTVNPIGNKTFCAEDTGIKINFTPLATGVIFEWFNNNPAIGLSASGTGDITSFTATNATNMPITGTITVTPKAVCTGASETFTITVNPKPTVNIINNSDVLTCNTPSIDLRATGGDSYEWSGNQSSNTDIITVTEAGTYTVTVTSTNGCINTKSITITANASIPDIIITTSPATTKLTCETTSITLTATGGETYVWSNASTASSITVNEAGDYSVTGTTTSNNCSATKSIAITATQSLPTIIVNHPAICKGDNATITASGADDYTWTPAPGLNAADGTSITVHPETTTTYTVEGTVKETGCKNTATATVHVETPPVLTLVSTPESVELGENVTITVSADRPGHGAYDWFINNEFYKKTDENNITLEPSAGRQHFRVDTRTTNLNCFASSGLYVDVNEMIPNIINPYNPDSKNCCLMVSDEGRQGYHVEIYNRYQQKVFEGYDGWDGTYRGALADPGTYFYRIFMKDGRIFKGTVEVAKF